jgi:Mrp family chromosome partitioning ATPase
LIVSTNIELRRISKQDELIRVIESGKLVPAARPRDLRISGQTREELVKLVQRLFMSPAPDGPRVVALSAVDEGGGCSWTSARIAEILADTTESLVCLIDANYRSKIPYREFQCPTPTRTADEEWSFAPIARTEESVTSNLWLLSFRPLTTECPTAASLERFQARLHDLRNDFGYVLIDAPPLKSSADAILLGRMADGLVVVVEANQTRREPAKRAKRLLDESGIPVLGAVLNKRVFPIPENLYRRL